MIDVKKQILKKLIKSYFHEDLHYFPVKLWEKLEITICVLFGLYKIKAISFVVI